MRASGMIFRAGCTPLKRLRMAPPAGHGHPALCVLQHPQRREAPGGAADAGQGLHRAVPAAERPGLYHLPPLRLHAGAGSSLARRADGVQGCGSLWRIKQTARLFPCAGNHWQLCGAHPGGQAGLGHLGPDQDCLPGLPGALARLPCVPWQRCCLSCLRHASASEGVPVLRRMWRR